MNIFIRDWKLVWVERATYTVNNKEYSYCFYKIYYSKSKNKYKLKTTGYDSKRHPYYEVALKKLIDFNKENL